MAGIATTMIMVPIRVQKTWIESNGLSATLNVCYSGLTSLTQEFVQYARDSGAIVIDSCAKYQDGTVYSNVNSLRLAVRSSVYTDDA